MKTIKIVGSMMVVCWLTFSINSCKKDTPEISPTVTTAAVTAITKTSAASGGEVTSDGGTAVVERGICFGTASNPTIGNSKVANGAGKGAFTADLAGLNAGTTYFLRAYATNRVGTA